MANVSETSRRAPKSLRIEAERARSESVLADLDTQLMLQVRGGDPDASNMLVRRNFDRVARYISRVVRDHRMVEDLSQEVFLQVLSNADRYQPTARFSTWLYRVATNTALNYMSHARVRQRATQVPSTEMNLPDRCREADPDRQLSLDELKNRVSGAIGDLPIKQRIALTLFEYEDLSYQQIATVLEVTVEAVRCLLTRARTTLRRKLADLV
jgi:RNA polymerase sigma-70 factor (ECF subfamily)